MTNLVRTPNQKAYHDYLRDQFSDADDVYLEICRWVTCKIKIALQAECNTSNSQLFQSCPACFYKLEHEPKLEYSCLLSFDGNNSLKRLGDKVRNQDSRTN